MSKPKAETKRTSETIRGEVETWQQRLAELERQHAGAVKRVEEIDRQMESLYLPVLNGDTTAKKTLSELEAEGEKTGREIKKLAAMSKKVTEKIGELWQEANATNRREAAQRILDRGPGIAEKMGKLDTLLAEAATLCRELKEIGVQNVSDAGHAGVSFTANRRFDPMHAVLAAIALHFYGISKEFSSLPEPSLRKPLKELAAESLEGAKNALDKALATKQDEDVGTEVQYEHASAGQ